MNVLLVTSKFPPEHSGSGGRLKLTYSRLRSTHPEIGCRVLTRIGDGAAAEGTVDGLPVRRLELKGRSHTSGPRLVRAFGQVSACISDTRSASRYLASIDPSSIDIVHTGGWSWLVYAACLWARRHGLPLVRELTSAADGPRSRGFGGILIRRTLDWSSLIVAISPHLADACAAAGYGAKTWCRPNPVDAGTFYPAGTDLKPKLKENLFQGAVPANSPLVLYVGHICPWKNQKFLIGVLKRLPTDHHLALVGPADAADKPYLDAIFSEASAQGVAARLHVIARAVDNVADFIRAADVFAFPSLAEGLGNVALESLMCGVPVAAHRLEGVTTWIVREDDNGALSGLETGAFAAAVERALGLAGRARTIASDAAERFSAPIIDAEYAARFHSLARAGRKP